MGGIASGLTMSVEDGTDADADVDRTRPSSSRSAIAAADIRAIAPHPASVALDPPSEVHGGITASPLSDSNTGDSAAYP